ncbi:MAG: DUF1513 domain-containing protein [Oligoflexia bacterium]|nr:DUF1513 domain-containing protein [Oligoflexia bacterium]
MFPPMFAPMLALLFALVGCTASDWEPRSLTPYPNPFTSDDPQWSPQPHRSKPQEIAIVGGEAWVSLPGRADDPDDTVVAVDLASGVVADRVKVGSNPMGIAARPDGSAIVVFNRFSNWMSVVDPNSHTEIERIPTDFYATEGVFSPDGTTLWVTNRWLDSVVIWQVDDRDRFTGLGSVRVGVNPRDIAISADGRTVAVANLTGLDVSIIDTATWEEIARVDLRSPPNGLAFVGDWLVVPTLSASSHHQPFAGPDTDGDGQPGDGTPNINFQDMQDELVVIDPSRGEIAWRYTSDSICCRDFRDVDPADLARHGDLLPPQDTWIVGGALPEQVVADGDGVWITYSGSDQVQRFDLDPDSGALTAGRIFDTVGHNPHGVAVTDDGRVAVVHRLGETLGLYREDGSLDAEVEVGDLSGGAYPATDAEIGELYNFVTSRFSVDGDQTCAACHREQDNINKVFAMPLALYAGQNSRIVMAARGAADTRPWFFEGAMDQTNFRPVINEFARIENFCCEDYTLFPDGAPADCLDNPPPECTEQPNAYSSDGVTAERDLPLAHPRPSTALTREQFYLERAAEVIGRTTSFGDGVFSEDAVTGQLAPVPLNLDGITRSLGVFLLQNTALLPNPNDPATSSALRGKAIFESTTANCVSCHPPPAFAVSTDLDPAGLPVRMEPVVTPDYDDQGVNLDLIAEGFISIFPLVEQDACSSICSADLCDQDAAVCDDLRNVRLNVTPLRGLWDRAPRLLHDGRANGLREALSTPGHPALHSGEQGFNERNGVPDTHGGTSQLSASELDDLISYVMTL